MLLDEARAGGRIPLIIGRALTAKARQALNLPQSDVFRRAHAAQESSRGFSLAQRSLAVPAAWREFAPNLLRTENHLHRFS